MPRRLSMRATYQPRPSQRQQAVECTMMSFVLLDTNNPQPQTTITTSIALMIIYQNRLLT